MASSKTKSGGPGSSVGYSVGDSLGASDGGNDGTLDGVSVGMSEGCSVGSVDGLEDGISEGAIEVVGCPLGSAEGIKDGVVVGFADTVGVEVDGAPEGLGEGTKLGTVVLETSAVLVCAEEDEPSSLPPRPINTPAVTAMATIAAAGTAKRISRLTDTFPSGEGIVRVVIRGSTVFSRGMIMEMEGTSPTSPTRLPQPHKMVLYKKKKSTIKGTHLWARQSLSPKSP